MFLDLNVPSEIKKYINMIFCVVIGLFYFLIVIFYIRVYLTKNIKYKDWKFNKEDFALKRLSDNPLNPPHIRAPFHEFQDFSEKIRFFHQKTHISPLFTTIFPNSPHFSTRF